MLGTEDDDVGLHAFLLEVFDGVLRGLGLEFFGRSEEGDIGEVDAEAVGAEFPLHLAEGLDVRQGLDVADGAAYLGDDEIEVAGLCERLDVTLNLVGDMRNDLHGLAKIVATAFFIDDILIDTSGGDIVGLVGFDIKETLVVPEVEVGLMPVHGDEALAVLVGVERARVHVDIRIELLVGDTETACLQEFAKRGSDDTFSERRGYASGDEDVFHDGGMGGLGN